MVEIVQNAHGHADFATVRANDRHARKRQLRAYLWASDFVVVVTVAATAQFVRFGEVGATPALRFPLLNYWAVSAVVVAVWMAALAINASRSSGVLGNGLEESRRVVAASLSVFGLIAVVSMLVKLEIARGYLAIALPLGLGGLLVSRSLIRRHVKSGSDGGVFLNHVLAVGNLHSVEELAESFARHPDDGMRLVGVCGPSSGSGRVVTLASGASVPMFSDDDVVSAVEQCDANTVILVSGHMTPERIRDLSWQLEKLDVDLVLAPGMVDVAAPRLRVRLAAGQPLICVDKPRYSGAKRFQKRAFDVCFALLVLCATVPVMIAAAVAVKLTSSGPVFYLSERIGLDGKSFRMVKLRTMIADADKQLASIAHLNECPGGVLFKIRHDPRVTPVGRFLRRSSIDELPQFINVLSGSMSIVGPRPPLPSEADTYDLRVRRRLLVRPGITGLWQVSGRSNLSWEDSVRLDLSYVENWSMVGDLVIAMKTASVVWQGSGAY